MSFREYLGLTLAVLVGTIIGHLIFFTLWAHFHGGLGG